MPASTVTEYLAALPADRREALTALGVPNALASPTLDPRDSNAALLISNNDWQDDPAQAAELIATGLAPTNPLDSGIAATLPPGLYTALPFGVNNGVGVGWSRSTTAGAIRSRYEY